MDVLKVHMHTHGAGGGHLSRVNSVYRGFKKAKIKVDFCVTAPRLRYPYLFEPGVRRIDVNTSVPDCDIFICDQVADQFVRSLPESYSRTFIGLRRMGRAPSRFPPHFRKVAIEPVVKTKTRIWPIICVWEEDILSKEDVRNLLDVHDDRPVRLICENGFHRPNVNKVFRGGEEFDGHTFYCSSNPDLRSDRQRPLTSFYPIARLYAGVDALVLGGGYNTVHEAMSFADLSTTQFIKVGRDDQGRRLKRYKKWENGRGSHADELAQFIVSTL